MKEKGLFVTLTLGLSLTFALLWVLASQSPSAVAAPSTGHVKAPDAPAAELHVCPSGCAYSSVQAAVDAANDGDVIKVAAGTYTGVNVRSRKDVTTTGVVTQVVYISKTVTVQGGYTTTNWTASDPEANPTTLDAQGQGRVLYITGDISPTIEGLRITGGDAAGLGDELYGDAGGGVYVFTATAAIMDNQVFNNTAEYGGGLYLYSSTTTLSGNIVSSNIADTGGGLCLLWSNAMLSGNTVSSNTGGGLCLAGSDATLSGNTVSSNTGVGLSLIGSDATLSGNTVSSNTGVGLSLTGSDATLSGNIVSSNTSGGLSLYRSDATLTNNIVADNQANTAGSALEIVSSSPRLLHNTIIHNTGDDGSGVYVRNVGETYSTVALTNTILVSHAVGISVTGGNTVTVNGVLWHDTPITVSQASTATVTAQNQYTGDPAFATDGYHLTVTSAAIDNGVDAGVTTDIDGEPRPASAGYDLGADEFWCQIYLPLVLRQ